MAVWEAEVKLRRNGRLVDRDSSGDCETPTQALWWAMNDLERRAEAHPENQPKETPDHEA